MQVFNEIDLSRAVPRNTVAITFRYQITRGEDDVPPLAELADNPQGQDSIFLTDDSGKVTLRLRRAQKLYYSLADPRLHLSLWIVEYRTLTRRSC
jgi:hypothetical protein